MSALDQFDPGPHASSVAMRMFEETIRRTDDIDKISRLLSGANYLVNRVMKHWDSGEFVPPDAENPGDRDARFLAESFVYPSQGQ